MCNHQDASGLGFVASVEQVVLAGRENELTSCAVESAQAKAYAVKKETSGYGEYRPNCAI